MRRPIPLVLLVLPLWPGLACSVGPEVISREDGPVALKVECSVDQVEIQDLKVRLREGRATAQFFLRNDAENLVQVQVTLEWFDRDGFLIEDSMEVDPRSRQFDLRPEERRTFTFYSPEGSQPTMLRCIVGKGGY